MGGVKAVWNEPQIDLPAQVEDPFAVPLVEAPIEEVGTPIDLALRPEQVRERFGFQMQREGRLEQMGITCDLKWAEGHDCRACPVSQAASKEDMLGILCRVGVKQYDLVDALTARGE